MSLAGGQTQATAADMSKRYPQFLLLGDSIVQFGSYLRDGVSLVAGLAEHCDRRLDVVNRGLSGYNTAHELVVLPHLIPPLSCAKVDYLLVLFGANDACLPTSPTKQHVPLENYRENLKTIITHPSVMAHKPKILLVTPPPINEHQIFPADRARGFTEMTRTSETTARYADVVRELAAEFKDDNVLLIDLWTALMKSALKEDNITNPNARLGSLSRNDSLGLKSLLLDGLHLTGAGYSVFLEAVLPAVGKEWKEEQADNPTTWIFPYVKSPPAKTITDPIQQTLVNRASNRLERTDQKKMGLPLRLIEDVVSYSLHMASAPAAGRGLLTVPCTFLHWIQTGNNHLLNELDSGTHSFHVKLEIGTHAWESGELWAARGYEENGVVASTSRGIVMIQTSAFQIELF